MNLAKINEMINLEGKHSLTNDATVLSVVDKMLEMEQVDCPVTHHFGPGIYMRELNIKAGVFSVAHYQKKAHLNFLVSGKVLMLSDDGTVKELTGPYIYTAPPSRKVGLIMEDMKWLNIYPTDETDIETLENTYLDKADNWKDSDEAKRQLERLSRELDRKDYLEALNDIGYTEEQVRLESEIDQDLIPFPFGSFGVSVSESEIEGKGLFAASPFKNGDFIAPARIDGKRTPAGRYINHSKSPNAEFVLMPNGDIMVAALRDITGCKGGFLGEEITIDYRRSRCLAQ